MSNVFDSISKYAVSGVASDEAYADLRGVAEEAYRVWTGEDARVNEFNAVTQRGEDEFMECNYNDQPKAKHTTGKRKGEWKYRTYLPKSYSSAKSSLRKALEAGIDPTGQGKSAVEKATKKTAVTAMSPEDKAKRALGALIKALNEMDPPEFKTQLGLALDALAAV